MGTSSDFIPNYRTMLRSIKIETDCIQKLIIARLKNAKPTMKKRMVYVLRKIGLLYKLKKILKK